MITVMNSYDVWNTDNLVDFNGQSFWAYVENELTKLPESAPEMYNEFEVYENYNRRMQEIQSLLETQFNVQGDGFDVVEIARKIVQLKSAAEMFKYDPERNGQIIIERAGKRAASMARRELRRFDIIFTLDSGATKISDEQIEGMNMILGTDGMETLRQLVGVMTASEVATHYELAEATVRQAINRKQIPARKSGGTWLVSRQDAEKRWGK